jgi:hypothetical protein
MAANQPTRPRGRPKSKDILVLVPIGTLPLRQGADDDLIAFFQALPVGKRRSGLKVALRAGGMKTVRVEDLTDDDELEEAAEGFLE